MLRTRPLELDTRPAVRFAFREGNLELGTTPENLLSQLAAPPPQGLSGVNFDKMLREWSAPLLQNGDLGRLASGLQRIQDDRQSRPSAQLLLARIDSWNG